MMPYEVLSKAPSISRKDPSVTSVFHWFLYICDHMMQCSFSGLPWLVGKLVLM
jgi:hypothetical protein